MRLALSLMLLPLIGLPGDGGARRGREGEHCDREHPCGSGLRCDRGVCVRVNNRPVPMR